MLNLILCASVVSVCLTDGSVMAIRTVRMGLTRVLKCAVSKPDLLMQAGLWGVVF